MENDQSSGIISFSSPDTPIGSLRFGGRLFNTAGTGFARHRVHGMFALVLLTGNGAGRYRDEIGTDRRVSAGDLIVVFPEVPHQYGPEAGDIWEEIFISFDGPAFEGWRADGLDRAHPVWSLDPAGEWAIRLEEILQMSVAGRTQACAAASAIHLFIADALAARSPVNEVLVWLEAACHALGDGKGAPSIEAIAKMAGIGHETFRKTFKTAIGETPTRYRRRMRLAQAATMLKRADLSLEMIAEALDFCDAFHLSKAFKQQYGISPAGYRRRNLE